MATKALLKVAAHADRGQAVGRRREHFVRNGPEQKGRGQMLMEIAISTETASLATRRGGTRRGRAYPVQIPKATANSCCGEAADAAVSKMFGMVAGWKEGTARWRL